MTLLQTSSAPEFLLFLGRFHPLIVHLPIGILLLAAVMELLSRRPRYRELDKATPFVLFVGAASAVVAALLGYFLSLAGDYEADTLFWHQWLGICLAVVAVLAWLIKTGRLKRIKLPAARLNTAFAIALLLLMTITGHLGGSLTHGSGYLTYYMPQPLRSLAGLPPRTQEKERPPITKLDSARIFADVVLPILEDRCQSCHNPNKKKGKLILTDKESILKGGKHGEVLTPGNPEESELFHRITLPEEDEDVMPPEGKKRLTQNQIRLLQWWIANGADFEKTVAELQPDEEARTLIAKAAGVSPDDSESPATANEGLLAVHIEAASPSTIEKIRQQGFKVYQIAQEVNYLDVDFSLADTTLSSKQLNSLLDAKAHIVWLNLSRSDITDEGLKVVGQLPNLIRLRLDQTQVTDAGIAHLAGLKELEYLNLYGTPVGDGIVETINQLPKLKKLFLWQTQVSPQAVEAMKQANPELEIDTGINVAQVRP